MRSRADLCRHRLLLELGCHTTVRLRLRLRLRRSYFGPSGPPSERGCAQVLGGGASMAMAGELESSKSLSGLLSGLAQKDFHGHPGITEELLRSQLYPEVPPEEFRPFLAKMRGILKVPLLPAASALEPSPSLFSLVFLPPRPAPPHSLRSWKGFPLRLLLGRQMAPSEWGRGLCHLKAPLSAQAPSPSSSAGFSL